MMKTKIFLFASAILIAISFDANAQAPEKFNYQGIARDSNGEALANQALGLKISILNPASTPIYVEEHSATSNVFGLYHVVIGDGTPVTGTMDGVNWAGGTKKIKVEIDPNGGTNYTSLGTTELLSVPYALYAKQSVWENNAGDISYSGGNVGIGTTSPAHPLHIEGAMGSNEFVRISPTSISGSGSGFDILELAAPSAASSYDFVEFNAGSSTVFVVNEDGSIESESSVDAVDFVSKQNSATTPGLTLIDNDSSDNWALTYAATDNLWFEHNGGLSSWISPNGTYNTSDRRLKTNIAALEPVMDAVGQIQVSRYSYKNDERGRDHIGFIAQDLMEQFPEMVQQAGKNEEGVNYYGVNYAAMSAVAIKAIQEQQKTIEKLQLKIAELERKIDE